MSLQLLSRWTCDDCGTTAEAGVCGSPTPSWFWWIPHIGITKHRCPRCEAQLRTNDPASLSKTRGHVVSG